MAAADQVKLRKRLENLLKLPENQICADCKKRGPRWASANLGIFVCIECSGIHRNLGVHISFVRSVNLDSWTVKQVEQMEEWGNARANALYEANVPAHVIRPKEGDPVRLVERYIRDKYEHKRYIASSIPPPTNHAAAEPVKEERRRTSTAQNQAAPQSRAPAAPAAPAAAAAVSPTPAPKPAEPSLLDFMNDVPSPISPVYQPAAPVAVPAAVNHHPGANAFGQTSDGFGAFDGPTHSHTGGFDAFASPAAPAPAPPAPAGGNSLLDMFGAPTQPAAPQAPAGFPVNQPPPKPQASADAILSLYSSGMNRGGPMMGGHPAAMGGHPGMHPHPAMGHPQGGMMHGGGMAPMHHPPQMHGYPGQSHPQHPPQAPQAMPTPHLQVPHYGNNMMNAYAHPPQAPVNPFGGHPGGMQMGGMHMSAGMGGGMGGPPVNPFAHNMAPAQNFQQQQQQQPVNPFQGGQPNPYGGWPQQR